MPTAKRSLRNRLPLIGGLLFMALFTAAVIWGVMHFIQGSDKPEPPKIQTISLVKPPPPKPPEEKPPEPQKIDKPKEEVKLDQPQPPQPEAPPPPPGGIPDGPAGGMATDLAAGSGIGIGGGSVGNERRSWYSNMISRQLEDELLNGLSAAERGILADLLDRVQANATRLTQVHAVPAQAAARKARRRSPRS